MNKPAIGPCLVSTLFSKHYQASINAWCDYLHQHVHSETTLSESEAQAWGLSQLANAKVTWLANELNEPWLRIIDTPSANDTPAFAHYGWLSLEISVSDVDQLYETIKESPFKIIGKPANLDVSDDIRAMQVVGLDGEVLYLTQVKAPVPPFELPFARCTVDKLFIPVAMVPSRADALAVYESFEHTKGLQFDTKITVINAALGHQIDRKHPVATVQLAGQNLVELDEISGLDVNTFTDSQLHNGIVMISFAVKQLPDQSSRYSISNPMTPDTKACTQACVIRGVGGELIELIMFDPA